MSNNAVFFGVYQRPPVEWKSEWRREFERRNAEDAAARAAERRVRRESAAAVQVPVAARRVVKRSGVSRGPDRQPRKQASNTSPCLRGCGHNATSPQVVCRWCRMREAARARARFCARGCGSRVFSQADICSVCTRIPATLPPVRKQCAAGCGRLLRRDALRELCKPCFKSSRLAVPASHPVACVLACGRATRNADGMCSRCRKRPQRRAAMEARQKQMEASAA